MNKVVLVGNGAIKNLGSAIDECDIVIRMHHADISVFKKDVGEKINIWVAPMGLIQPWMQIPEEINNASEVWTFNQERGNCGANHILRNKYGMRVIGCGKEFRNDIYCHLERNIHPTKGYLALQFALMRLPLPIYITGFSFYKTKEAWFWDSTKREMPSVYDMKYEETMIKSLIKSGEVRWLQERRYVQRKP